MNTKSWSVQFKPARGSGPWMCYTIEAATEGAAVAIGWRYILIEGGAWKLAKIYEIPTVEEAA